MRMVLYLSRLGTEDKFYLRSEKDKFLIGRNEVCDFTFTSLYISRLHCEIQRLPPNGTLIIKNLKETNSTYVDDLQLADKNKCAELRVGSRIGLGVPLTYASRENISNTNFVFLSLCTAPETEKEDDDQTVTFQRARHASSSSRSSAGEESLVSKDIKKYSLTTSDTSRKSRAHTRLSSVEFCQASDVDSSANSQPKSQSRSRYSTVDFQASVVDSSPTSQPRVNHDPLVLPIEKSRKGTTCSTLQSLHESQTAKQTTENMTVNTDTRPTVKKNNLDITPSLKANSVAPHLKDTAKLITQHENSLEYDITDNSSSGHKTNVHLEHPCARVSTCDKAVSSELITGVSDIHNSENLPPKDDDISHDDSDSVMIDLTQDDPVSPSRNEKRSENSTALTVSSSNEVSLVDISNESQRNRRNSVKRKRGLVKKAYNDSDDESMKQSDKDEEILQSLSRDPLQSDTIDEAVCTEQSRKKSKLESLSNESVYDKTLDSSTSDKNNELDTDRNLPMRGSFIPTKKQCSVTVTELPKKIVDGIFKGKTVIEDGNMDLVLQSPVSERSMVLPEVVPVTESTDKSIILTSDRYNMNDSSDMCRKSKGDALISGTPESTSGIQTSDEYSDMDELPNLIDVNEPSSSTFYSKSRKRSWNELSSGSSFKVTSSDDVEEILEETDNSSKSRRHSCNYTEENTSSVCRKKPEMVTEIDNKGRLFFNSVDVESGQEDITKISSVKSTQIGSKQENTSRKSNVKSSHSVSRSEDASRISSIKNAQEESRQEDTTVLSNARCVSIKEEKEDESPSEVKIKEEKLDDSMGVVIKQEPQDNEQGESSTTSTVYNVSDDNDDVLFMYSQVDDTIWLSSDEEEETPSKSNTSFGPLPPSPDLHIKDLFEENDEDDLFQDNENILFQESNEAGTSRQDLDSAKKVSPIKKEPDDVDDQWFPILSQAFWDDDDDVVEITDDDSHSSPSSPPSSPPSSSPPVHTSDEQNDDKEEELDEWWPQLSQGFFDDNIDGKNDAESAEDSEDATHVDQQEPSSTHDIDFVLRKIKGSHPRKAILTAPKTPPTRRKKQSSSCKEFYGKSRGKKTENQSHKIEKKRSPIISPPLKKRDKKDKKNSSLRENLSSKFNLAPYSATLDKTKEKHHLVPKVSEDSKKSPVRPHASSKTLDNISIQKKSKSKSPDEKEKVRTGKVKVTKKTRFEKLTETCSEKPNESGTTKKTCSEKLREIDMFSTVVSPSTSSQKSSTSSQKSTFKIPKSKGKTKEHFKKTSPDDKEDSRSIVNKKKSESVKTSEKIQENSDKLVYIRSIVSKKKPESAKISEKVQDGPSNLVDAHLIPQANANNDQQKNGSHTPQNSVINKNDPINIITKGILKLLPQSNYKPKKSVHFPRNDEDLVKAKLISPRKRCDHAGLPEVRAREIQPFMLQKLHNIPHYFMECFLYHICSWNFDWLRQYHTAHEKNEARGSNKPVQPPPVGSSKNYPTLILYNSFNDYKEIFSNLIYLEVWENIYKDWLRYRESSIGLPAQVEFIKPAFVVTATRKLTFWTLKLTTLITEQQSINGYHPRQGSLISIRIHEGTKGLKVFGYVDYVTKIMNHIVTSELRKAVPQANVCLMLGVRVTKDPITKVRPGSFISFNNVSYLKPNTRLWEGLCKLPLSPLCKDILQPNVQAFICNHACQYLVENMQVNDPQQRAVVEVSSKCIFDPQIPKFSLIHGPPGTGKTRTISALIAQMVKLSENQNKGCRVLLCAPSNAAADELTLRLGKLRDIGISLRVVRVGVKQNMRNEVLGYTLDALVEKQIRMEISAPKNFSTRKEWERRKVMVEKAAEDLQNARKENKSSAEIQGMEMRLFELARSKANFEKSFRTQPSMPEMHEMQRKWQEKVLLNAEVVTTTLGSCMSGAVGDIMPRYPGHFTCCIIDEAGQCQESETWLPLLLGVKKLVLVGDHKQLPATVLSRLAQNKNLKQSLFERFYHRLVVELQEEKVVHTLSVQYRMHPEIAKWPSLHFYQDRLKTCSRIEQARIHLFKPYILFDLKTSQERTHEGHELYNPSEASFIFKICEVLEDVKYKDKVAVITPYQRQKSYLEERLMKFKGALDLVISTIDAFQGQERDIVILSFVRGNNLSKIGFLSDRQRMNVALTRARKSCFVVASLSSLSNNSDCLSLINDATTRGLVCTITKKEENDKTCIKSMLGK